MSMPTNVLAQVKTYNDSALAYFQNLNCFISTWNTKFKEFNKIPKNLGDTVTFDMQPRYQTSGDNSLVVSSWQGSNQIVKSLTVDKADNVPIAFTAEQFIFNVRDYMDKFGKSAMVELSATVEADVALNCVNHTFRFYGSPITGSTISSYGDLANAVAMFRTFGVPRSGTKGYLPDILVPTIINSGLSQFVTNRNEKTANSWELGEFTRTQWYQSNLLPIHTSGTVGDEATEAGRTLTVVSTDDVTGANITEITLSGATADDADAIKNGDLAEFVDGVTGMTNVRYLTYTGHQVSAAKCQIRVTADAAAAHSGNVTIKIYPALCIKSIGTGASNINTNIVAGMKLRFVPSHRAGLLLSGNAGFIAMPELPDQRPFETGYKADQDTAVSVRTTYGHKFGENFGGLITDCIWGSTLVDEYAMRLIFPL